MQFRLIQIAYHDAFPQILAKTTVESLSLITSIGKVVLIVGLTVMVVNIFEYYYYNR